jgi:hypothetical protein
VSSWGLAAYRGAPSPQPRNRQHPTRSPAPSCQTPTQVTLCQVTRGIPEGRAVTCGPPDSANAAHSETLPCTPLSPCRLAQAGPSPLHPLVKRCQSFVVRHGLCWQTARLAWKDNCVALTSCSQSAHPVCLQPRTHLLSLWPQAA